jgi:lipid-binding SYLF domain-containing protein
MRTKWFAAAVVACLALSLGSIAWSADEKDSDKSDIQKRIDASATVLTEVMSTPDSGIPEEILSGAKCIAIVPSMLKAGFIVGGSHGKGVATCRSSSGWSAPAPFSVTGGSWGLQIGGEAVDLVMLVMNQKGMDHLLASKFKLGADASVAAGPVGRHAAADTDWKMRAEVLTYSRSRGVFAGLTLNGAVIKQDKDETRILYGHMVSFSSLLKGTVPPPAGTQEFLSTVRKYTAEAKDKEQGGLSLPNNLGPDRAVSPATGPEESVERTPWKTTAAVPSCAVAMLIG